MARIISFSVPEDWELTDEVMKMHSSEIRDALIEGVKVLKARAKKQKIKEVE